MINLNIAENIKTLRISKKWTQKELGQKLYVSDKTISKWESNRSVPDIFMIDELAKIFNVSVEYILNIEKSSNSKNRKIFRLYHLISKWAKKNAIFSIFLLMSLISLIVLSIFRDEISYFYLQFVMMIYIILLCIKYTKWYAILFLLLGTQLMDQMIVFLQLHLLDSFLLVPLFIFLILLMVFIIKEMIISKKWRHLTIFIDIFLILLFMKLVMNAFVVSYHITSSNDYSDILSTTNYWVSVMMILLSLVIIGALHQWIIPKLSKKRDQASIA